MKKHLLSAALLLGACLMGQAEESPGYLDLNGSDRYMLIPNDAAFDIPADGTRTVAFDVKLNATGTNQLFTNRVRDYSGGNNNNVSGFAFYTVSNNTTVSFNYPGSSWTARHNEAGSHISTGTWHHLCWVYSGTTATFYVDGSAVSTVSNGLSQDIPSLADILVGAGYVMSDNTTFSIDNLTGFTNGQIDNLRVYAEALSGSEVADDNNSDDAPLSGKTVIAAYDFDAIEGTTVTDISGNGHDGQLRGTWPDYGTDGGDGGDGGDNGNTAVVSPGYLDLDGVNRFMLIPNNSAFDIAAGGTRTVSFDVKLNATGTNQLFTNRVRDYSGGNNNNVSGFAFYTVSNNTTVSFNYPGSSWTARHNEAGSHISTGTWHHLCWVYSGTTATFYVDGSAYSIDGLSQAIPSLADILVGAGYVMSDNTTFSIDNLTGFTNGQIDNVRIYSEALTATEVTQDGNSDTPLAGKTVIAAYDFTNIVGTTVPDISGNGHDGQLRGTWPEYGAVDGTTW